MDSFLDEFLYDILLQDRTFNNNIVWSLSESNSVCISTNDAKKIKPRNKKTKTDISKRVKNKAEVFTPSSVCKIQNDLVDNFALNEHSFWQDYVLLKMLEITCGEAPYLTNWYDAVTGEYINLNIRVGLLDRKLRMINANIQDEKEWILWAERAVQSVYGYDIQGDNVYLARKNILCTVNEYFKFKYEKFLERDILQEFAKIVSWNVWQMDGLVQNPKTKVKDWENDKLINFWDLKNKKRKIFYAVVGNPPYQGKNHQQIYTDFYLMSQKLGNIISLIFPVGWQEPKNANNLSKLNNEKVKKDKQIVFIDNKNKAFPNMQGAEWTNIVLWKKGYDNGLGGKQLIYTNAKAPIKTELLIKQQKDDKPKELIDFTKSVKGSKDFISISAITSTRKPYGLPTKVFKDSNIESLYKTKQNSDDIKLYANKTSGIIIWAPNDYKFPIQNKNLHKYKVFIPYAWGNMDEKKYLGGAFADIIIASPNEACTETYLESGCFDDYETAKKHAKYLMTKFLRALLYVNKTSQHSTTAWGAIPMQDYSEDWWNKSIDEIDKELMKKYNVPQNIQDFVFEHIQPKTEKNITNYKK